MPSAPATDCQPSVTGGATTRGEGVWTTGVRVAGVPLPDDRSEPLFASAATAMTPSVAQKPYMALRPLRDIGRFTSFEGSSAGSDAGSTDGGVKPDGSEG